MSVAYKMAKKYYDNGLWGKDRLDALLAKGKLTQEEYDEIVGTEDETTTEEQ